MKLRVRLFIFIFIFALIAPSWSYAKEQFGVQPVKPAGGGKWRIGYYQGGEYINYQQSLVSTVEGLAALGWIKKPAQSPPEGADAQSL
jgi:hypothetical protein